jgi:hypothetical protein
MTKSNGTELFACWSCIFGTILKALTSYLRPYTIGERNLQGKSITGERVLFALHLHHGEKKRQVAMSWRRISVARYPFSWAGAFASRWKFICFNYAMLDLGFEAMDISYSLFSARKNLKASAFGFASKRADRGINGPRLRVHCVNVFRCSYHTHGRSVTQK